MFPGALMLGAKDRLLPPSIPYRFFATAIVLHVGGWACLLAGYGNITGYMGGQGAVLAGLHLVTLGVLAMTAIGAAFQMLPVATRHPIGPAWMCRLTWWLFAPGVVALAAGMATGWRAPLHGGAALTVAGLAVFAGLVVNNLRKVGDLPAVTWHVWLSMASLAALAGLGVALVVDWETGFLADRGAVAAAHAVLAGYGFMGMLVMGFSYVLVPMFVLAQSVSARKGKQSAVVSAFALALGAGGAIAGRGDVAAVGALVGLGAVGLHLHALAGILKTRMRKKLEPFFRLIKAAWVMLPVSLLAGLALALGVPPERAAPLWGFLLVFGWLLSFVTAILQRIMPFLASMHSAGHGGKPALLSHLVAARPLAVHAALHGCALVLVAAGLGADAGPPVTVGAAAGLAGSVAFAVFSFELMRRYRAHHSANFPRQDEGHARC